MESAVDPEVRGRCTDHLPNGNVCPCDFFYPNGNNLSLCDDCTHKRRFHKPVIAAVEPSEVAQEPLDTRKDTENQASSSTLDPTAPAPAPASSSASAEGPASNSTAAPRAPKEKPGHELRLSTIMSSYREGYDAGKVEPVPDKKSASSSAAHAEANRGLTSLTTSTGKGKGKAKSEPKAKESRIKKEQDEEAISISSDSDTDERRETKKAGKGKGKKADRGSEMTVGGICWEIGGIQYSLDTNQLQLISPPHNALALYENGITAGLSVQSTDKGIVINKNWTPAEVVKNLLKPHFPLIMSYLDEWKTPAGASGSTTSGWKFALCKKERTKLRAHKAQEPSGADLYYAAGEKKLLWSETVLYFATRPKIPSTIRKQWLIDSGFVTQDMLMDDEGEKKQADESELKPSTRKRASSKSAESSGTQKRQRKGSLFLEDDEDEDEDEEENKTSEANEEDKDGDALTDANEVEEPTSTRRSARLEPKTTTYDHFFEDMEDQPELEFTGPLEFSYNRGASSSASAASSSASASASNPEFDWFSYRYEMEPEYRNTWDMESRTKDSNYDDC